MAIKWAIMARNVRKSFQSGSRTTPILRGISMVIAQRETVFLMGPSGSGKTTLLSILGCILTPDETASSRVTASIGCLGSIIP